MHPPVQWHPSPNHGPRRDGLTPDLIVLHYTAMKSAAAALERLCDPSAEVSAHYLIGGDGTIWQMVDEKDRAWHAGAGSWRGLEDINSRSIGIELDNRGDHPFSDLQMSALEQLMPGIADRWGMPPENVIAHSDMAPDRKFDPGGRFDWQRLARQGLSVWPEPDNGQGADFLTDASRFGYGVPDSSEETLQTTLNAFRARFRPFASGALCEADKAEMHNLARRFGVDPATPNT